MIRAKWLRYSILPLGFALLALAGGCGGSDDDSTSTDGAIVNGEPTPGGTIVRRLESECKTLNWVLYSTQYENYVLRYLYDPLIEINEKLELTPVLAESYSVSDDRLRITVQLRENIHWHDGEPITSADVKFTIDKIKDPAVPALNKEGYFDKLDHIEVVDDRTVVFVWKEEYSPSLYAISQLWPIPEHIYGTGDFLSHPANRAPVGSGPFKFEEWKTSQYIKLVRSDNYYGQKAYLDAIIFRVIEDNSVALHAMRGGDLDEMRLTQIQWERQTNDADFNERFTKHHYYVPSYNYLGWNCRSMWFGDPRVRRAMTMLFDRESVNAKIYSGFAKLVSGPFYINSWSYDRSVAPHPFDPQRAKELLTEAGWVDTDSDGIRERGGVKFEFELLITSSNIAAQFAQLLQEEAGKAGIRIKIRQLEGATFFSRVDNGEFDSCLLSWGLDLDPDIYDTFHSSMVPPKGLNHGFYSNARVDSLLEAGRAEFDQDKRATIYHQIHRILHRDQPYTFINAVPEKRPVAKRIKGVVISPNGPFNFHPGANYWYIDRGNGRVAADGDR